MKPRANPIGKLWPVLLPKLIQYANESIEYDGGTEEEIEARKVHDLEGLYRFWGGSGADDVLDVLKEL